MRFGSVYQLTNVETGDTYIGITTQTVSARWREHRYKANGARCNTWLHRAIRKYGPSAFIVEEVASAISRPALLAAEIELIHDRRPTYNQSHGGEGTTGRKFSPDVLAARNAKLKGRTKTADERARISAGCRAAMTPERKAALSEQLAQVRTRVDEAKRVEAVRRAASGRAWSDEARAKLSASCMGRRYSREVIDRMRRSKMKPIICTTNGVCYANAKEAAEAVNVGHRSVLRVLSGAYPAVKGFAFKYGE